MSKRAHPERDLQIATAGILDRIPGLLWCHVPNEQPLMGALRRALIGILGQARGIALAAKIGAIIGSLLRAQGVKPGVPDVMIFTPPYWHPSVAGLVRGAYIELKSSTGKPTPEQIAWQDELRKRGWVGAVCRSTGEVVDKLKEWGYIR